MDEPFKTGAVESAQRADAAARAVEASSNAGNATQQNTPDYPLPRKHAVTATEITQDAVNGTSGTESQPPNARQQLVLLQQIITLACFGVTVLNGLLPLYSKTVGAEGLDVGFLWALRALMTALPRPIIGRAIDNYGRKVFLLGGVALIVVSMICFAYARTFTFEIGGTVLFVGTLSFGRFMLYAGQIIQGLGLGTILLASLTMTADLAKTAGRGTSFGYTEQAQYRGGLLGALIAVPIILVYGLGPEGVTITPEAWTRMFLIFAGVAIVALILTARRLKDTKIIAHSEPEAASPSAGKVNPQLYVLMAIIALTSASAYGLMPFILRYLEDHITPRPELIAFAYIPAAIVWGTLPARMGRYSDRFGRKPVMVVGLICSAILSLFIPLVAIVVPPSESIRLLGYAVPIALILLSIFVAAEAVTYSAATPAEQALASDMMGGRARGRGFGLYTFARSAGEVIGPIAMGAVYEFRPSGAFIVNTIILIIGSLLVWFALQDPAKPRRVP
jgi:MFS family permease